MTVAYVFLLYSLGLGPLSAEDAAALPLGKILIISEDANAQPVIQTVNDGIRLEVRPHVDDPGDDLLGVFMAALDASGSLDVALLAVVIETTAGETWERIWFLDQPDH